MKKKNTSDRKKLKSKYTEAKKRKQRRIKVRKDMKKNPNKYHKKKSDPGVPNSAPFKLALLDERDRYLQQKEVEKQKKREKIIKARQKMREGKIAEKRKLTDVLSLEDEADNNHENGETVFSRGEMILKTRPKKLRKGNNKRSLPVSEDGETMEVDEKEKQRVAEAQAAAKLLARKARQQQFEFHAKMASCKNHPERLDLDYRFNNWSDRVFYRQVRQVVDAADILLEVVDARDPMGTRCSVLESLVRARPSKKLVLVLNKADLVPKSNLEAWLKYLRAEAPTVAFKAATQRVRKFAKTIDRMVHIGQETLRTPKSMGCDVLMQLLKNYARSYPGVGAVVGVVGLPNVGKSSLINSLKKVKTCDVAPVPGSTRAIKEIKLDAKLHLLDCPGVVLPGEDMSAVDAVLRNVVKLETVRNPVDVALEIFRRSDSLKLALFYEVRKVDDGEQFLALLAKRCKKMIKKGLSDQEAAAKKLIYDWNHGILKYYTEPPKRSSSDVITEVVTTLSPAFDLDTLAANHEDAFLSYLDNGRSSVTIKLPAGTPLQSCFGFDAMEEESPAAADKTKETVLTEKPVAAQDGSSGDEGNDEDGDGDTSNDFQDAMAYRNQEKDDSDEGVQSTEEGSHPENSDVDAE